MAGVAIRPPQLLKPRLQALRNGWRKAEPGRRWAMLALGAVGLVVWASLFGGLIFAVNAFYQVEVFGPLITRKLLELLLVALFGMLLFSNVVTALSSFYLSEDLELLLSLPISRPTFFYTRFLDTLLQSSWMMGMFGLPVFLSFGIAAGAGSAYYLSLLAVVPAFLVIPSAVGAAVASLLVSGFSARRAREMLALVGVLFLIAVFILLRLMQPERLVNAQDFESLAAYVATLQNPMPAFFPPTWASAVLGASLQGRPYPWLELGLLVSGAVGITGMSRAVTSRLWADGWTRAQEANAARLAKAGLFHAFLVFSTSMLPKQQAAILIKDAKTFVRDPSQWSQLFLLGSLIVIYLFSVQSLPTDFVSAAYVQGFKNALAFLNLGMAGFVMAAIAVRFQFAQISAEGRAFWILRTAPITAERYLWTKALPGLLPMMLVGMVLIGASNFILGAPLALQLVGMGTAVGFAFGISGIAVGMGAQWPDFKVDNVARAAAGPGAMVFMLGALVLVFGVVALEGLPVYFLLRSSIEGSELTGGQWLISGLLYLASAALCAAAAIVPVRRAAPGLWARAL